MLTQVRLRANAMGCTESKADAQLLEKYAAQLKNVKVDTTMAALESAVVCLALWKRCVRSRSENRALRD